MTNSKNETAFTLIAVLVASIILGLFFWQGEAQMAALSDHLDAQIATLRQENVALRLQNEALRADIKALAAQLCAAMDTGRCAAPAGREKEGTE